jgi:hypothetical protein
MIPNLLHQNSQETQTATLLGSYRHLPNLLPPRRGWKHINQYAAVHKQRPVDGSEVHEHDQQNEQVIKESNDPQHACRIKA